MRLVRPLAFIAFVLSTSTLATPHSSPFKLRWASAEGKVVGCSRDTDCKGDRICAQGACEDPASSKTNDPRGNSGASGGIRLDSGSADRKFFLLEEQIHALQENKPSVAGGVVLTLVGGSLFLVGTIILIASSVGVGLILMLVSAVPLGLGIGLWLVNSLRVQEVDQKIQALEDQKRSLNSLLLPSVGAAAFTLARF